MGFSIFRSKKTKIEELQKEHEGTRLSLLNLERRQQELMKSIEILQKKAQRTAYEEKVLRAYESELKMTSKQIQNKTVLFQKIDWDLDSMRR